MVGKNLAIAVAVGLIAAVWDLKTRQVPNWLTFSAVSLGFVLGCLHGPAGFLLWLEGTVTGFMLLFIPYVILGGIGEGDLKLAAAFGALGGPVFAFRAVVYGAILGGIGAVVFLLKSGEIRKTFSDLKAWALGVLCGGPMTLPQSNDFIPYAPFLAGGAILALMV